MISQSISYEIIAAITPNGIVLDANPTKNKDNYTNPRLVEDFCSNPYRTLFYFGFEDKNINMTDSLAFVHNIAASFVEKTSKSVEIEFTRVAPDLNEEEINTTLYNMPYVIGGEFADSSWLQGVWDNLKQAFSSEIGAFEGTVEQFFLTHNSHINVAGRVFFHLVESKSAAPTPFAFLATYSRSAENGKVEHLPLQNALQEFGDEQSKLLQLLSTVTRAAEASEFIEQMLESGELFMPLGFSESDAYTFLKEIAFYEECGIMCRIPDWWKRQKSSVKMSVTIGEHNKKSYVGLNSILDIVPSLSVDGVPISRGEIELLLKQTEGLAYIKGKWVEIDHAKLSAALKAFDSISNSQQEISLADAMRLQLGLPVLSKLKVDIDAEITHGKWLRQVFDDIQSKRSRQSVVLGDGFRANLRQYQQVGVDWLATMKSVGFGALLADDMGLGKTVQILALLDSLREQGAKTLLIIPASLIGNWQNELKKFAPLIRFEILHGAGARKNELDEADLFITTYTTCVRIVDKLKERSWDLIILDEAQAIKNPATQATKAIKSIPAVFRIAMTGTPIENRLSELWSIFDYLNSGLLGNCSEFGDFVKNLRQTGSYSRLRRVVSPFILRRLKTDKSIIKDLPDKFEVKNYVELSKKQTVLYSALIKDLKASLDRLEGIERKGVVLATLMKIKQICNHPDQYLGQDVFSPAESGKFAALAELIETIRDKRERVLVFTQFKEMCKPISDYLEGLFGRKGLVLHGSIAVNKRAQLVDEFNGDEYVPYMVLSLKAGGVGLNLTAANHVIHFDRWWNPAVENQATDRAFRIGQKKDVLVHKLIARGTIEEKIDKMIEDKLALSGEIVQSSGEGWITEMTSSQLVELFKLEV